MVLSRKLRYLLTVAGIKEVGNLTKTLLEKLKGRGHLKDQGVNRSIILKCILRKECIKMLTESCWVGI